jgi:hypothetical protein
MIKMPNGSDGDVKACDLVYIFFTQWDPNYLPPPYDVGCLL